MKRIESWLGNRGVQASDFEDFKAWRRPMGRCLVWHHTREIPIQTK